ncbi:transcription termination factor 2, mitochondrial [Melanotaenia boesemani]|uniref:transcription termination factor 2, mitochondrial n=1 Tax=Melanotaenia boesemani TaxID=1250792 RepID=UPI001C03FFFC|nr:transcription termination factor 2, mitochondrial [Melanotaenia boesemani]
MQATGAETRDWMQDCFAVHHALMATLCGQPAFLKDLQRRTIKRTCIAGACKHQATKQLKIRLNSSQMLWWILETLQPSFSCVAHSTGTPSLQVLPHYKGEQDFASMLRLVTTSLCLRCQHVTALPFKLRPHATLSSIENQQTVEALYDLSVDLQKVRKLKGWVLRQSPAYTKEVAGLLKDMGATGPIIAHILAIHPEAVLCDPEHIQTQRDLWMSVCPSQKELVGIIEKFPASFFTSSSHHDNQRNNIAYFQSLNLNKRIITKLMATAPQSFSRPVEQNQMMVHTLRQTYQELGGEEANMKIWLQKLLSQNPFVLLKPPEVLRQNLMFLRDRGFSTVELLQLLTKLRGVVTELNPESMHRSLAFSQNTISCSEAVLRGIILKCPALLYFPESTLGERFEGLIRAGISMSQITETPTVLELTTQIVHYRIQRLKARGYDIRTGSLDVLNGTKKDFEMSFGRLQLRRQRPLFNPVAPLKVDD